ncbi:tetratricopeptide repeat protein [Elizabethkingia meningoseptica]|uniref:tetratricopeptide repeat protein n=1 Tax=Elizabethkingia meningoseptica TaxID=238 RepID=UPI0008417064|nr:tetratricopeptide repeat protein [Elizabethkingia meningoseptica]ODM52421.1 hypothetical protein BES09_12285 [Elizabethkingia meningoseptica]OHT27334.1 hypothetical protein BFF93_12295 [Elizabethkingia meningoseptica]OPC12898.1 hypothetical protein BAX93_04045 [Elizabethkingia meningoseptica]
MKERFGLSKKIVIGAAAFFAMNMVGAQTVADGINDIDGYKFGKAKEVYTALVNKEPSDANYFYLGNTYLVQSEPDFDKAAEYFNKGVALDAKKSFFSRIGVASIKLGKGDKAGAVADFSQIAKDSREKDPEVLYRIGEALSLYPNHNDPKLSIEYLNKAVNLAEKKGVPEYYYYTLGDANRLNKNWGDAMNAYDRALEVAKNKAAVYTRIGTLWTSAKQWERAKDNIDKAIQADPNYAPAYKARGGFNIIYQKFDQAAQDYKKYLDLADSDPNTILDYAKLAFLAKDYTNANTALDSVFDKIDDPIKYRIKAYLQYQAKDYNAAKTSLDTFLSKAEKSRLLPSDSGLEGLILAGIAKEKKDSALLQQAQQKVAVAKAAKDETFDWDTEYAVASGTAPKVASGDGGPSSPAIEAMKKQLAADPKNTDLLYKLANAYQEVQNWGGAASAWSQMASLLQTWEPAYYSLGYALQKNGDADGAIAAYQKYIDVLSAKPAADQAKGKELLANSYYNMASLTVSKDKAKALEYVTKALEANPSDADSAKLKEQLSK